jgi:hypothetical protein
MLMGLQFHNTEEEKKRTAKSVGFCLAYQSAGWFCVMLLDNAHYCHFQRDVKIKLK